jgi:hypothetical protein
MNRKSLCVIVVASLACVLGEGVARAQALVPYTNPTYRYSLQVPFGWEQRTMGGTILWLSPQEGPGDLFRENVNVTTENLPSPMTVGQYAVAATRSMAQMLQGFAVLEQGQTVLAGQPAHWMVYNHFMGQPLQVLVFFVVRGTTAYVLTCTASPPQFPLFRPRFSQIAATLATF